MKPDEPPLRPRHQHEHAPTVIHHPEEDETLLYRWFHRVYEKGPVAWALACGTLVAVVVVALIVRGLMAGRSVEANSWKQLMLAEGPDPRVALAKSAVGPVAGWALIQAAEVRYQEGFRHLPQSRDAALPLLKQAHDLYAEALRKSPEGSPQRPLAALGMARALEARGDLDAAIEQYRSVAKSWPNSPYGWRAAQLADQLQAPQGRQFYEQFAAYKPAEVRLPPGGRSNLIPGLPGTSPGGVIPGLPGGGPGRLNLDPPAGHPPLTGPASGLPPALEQETPPAVPVPLPAPDMPKSGPSAFRLDPLTPPVPPASRPPAEPPKAAPAGEPPKDNR